MGYKFTAKKFVEVWMDSENFDDVIKKLGISRNTVRYFAQSLRKKGVKLPEMKKGRPVTVVDVDELNTLIRGHLKRRTA